MKTMKKLLVICLVILTVPALGRAQDVTQYRLIAATHASALQQEMQDAPARDSASVQSPAVPHLGVVKKSSS
jgi:hypothetical protein